MPKWIGMGGMGFHTLPETLSEMPMWDEDQTAAAANDRSGGAGMNDLGRCSQKATNMEWWIQGVHQLMFHLGTARSGAQARATHYQRSNQWYKRPQKKGKWSKYPQ